MNQPNPEPEMVQVGSRTYRRVNYAIFVTVIAFLAYALSSFDTALFGVALPAIAKSLAISPSTAELAASVATAVGVAFVFLIGPLADRWGRRTTMQFVLLFTAVFSAITSIVGSFIQLLIVRGLAGVGFDNIGPSETLVSEESPKQVRGFLMAIIQSGYGVGLALGSGFAAFFLPTHWRILFVWVAIPAFVVFAVAYMLREPPQYYEQLSRKRKKEERTSRYEVFQLFQPEVRRQAIVVILYNIFVLTGFGAEIYFVSIYLTTVVHIALGSVAILLSISGWVGVLSYLLFGFLGDRFSPKFFLVLLPILAGVSYLAYMNVHGSVAYYTITLAGAIFFTSGVYGCYNRYLSESFPARMRGTALTMGIGFGNVALVIVPLVGAALFANHDPQFTFLMVGLAMIAGGVLMLAGRTIPPGRELKEVAGE